MMNIAEACEHFKELLLEQQKRLETLRKEKKDFTSMDTITIGLVDGDGIGPIIMEQALRVIEKLLQDELAAGKVTVKDLVNRTQQTVDRVDAAGVIGEIVK